MAHPITRRNPAAAWQRFIAWQIKSRLAQEVIVPWIGGLRLAVRRGMTGATGNIYVGLHEFADMAFVLHLLRDGDMFLDVGANVGSYSVLAAGVCGARVQSFEPDPDTMAHLQRNIELNALAGRVTQHRVALGAKSGTVRFTVGLDTTNRIVADDRPNTRLVSQVALDMIVMADAPLLMKIDVEGYEDEVLAGARRVLENPALKALLIEAVSPAAQALLTKVGFEQRYYDPFQRSLDAEPAAVPAANALFVRDFEFVRGRVQAAPRIAVLGASI